MLLSSIEDVLSWALFQGEGLGGFGECFLIGIETSLIDGTMVGST